MSNEMKIIISFETYIGKKTFVFSKEDVIKIATMPAQKSNSENKIALSENNFFVIRDMNEFQYYYKSGSGTRASSAMYNFPNIAKKNIYCS